MMVKCGFPDDTFTKFYAYYAGNDGQYKDPLMITLTIDPGLQDTNTAYIPSIYYITKTDESGTKEWERLRTDGSLLTDKELCQTVANIKMYNKLNLEKLDENIRNKLRDVTKNLIIDLTKEPTKDGDVYNSNGVDIPYKKVSTDYLMISHANLFLNFTVTKIKFDDDNSINSDPLLPSTTLVDKLISYKYPSTKGIPLLIYMHYNEDPKKMWLYRHYGDNKWVKLSTGAPANENDSKNILGLLTKFYIPHVEINLSKPADNNPYIPAGTSLKFNVTKEENLSKFGYYGFKHVMQGNGNNFTIKSINHEHIPNDLKLNGELTSIAIFLRSENQNDIPLIIYLTTKGPPPKHRYYYRVGTDPTKQKPLFLSREMTLELDNFRETLDYLKKINFPEPPPSNVAALAGTSAGTAFGTTLVGFGVMKLLPILKTLF